MAFHNFWTQSTLRSILSRSFRTTSTSAIRPISNCCIIARTFTSCSSMKTKCQKISAFRMVPFNRSGCYPLFSMPGNRTVLQSIREFGKSSKRKYGKFSLSEKHNTTAMYVISVVILVCGGSYAAVPLYRLYCQVIENLAVRLRIWILVTVTFLLFSSRILFGFQCNLCYPFINHIFLLDCVALSPPFSINSSNFFVNADFIP